MAYLLVGFFVLLALVPLLQFMPSRRQRTQAQLRQAAALAGLYVEFRDLPLPPARRERLHAAERQVLYYGLRLAPERGRGRRAQAWWREEDGGWRGAPARVAPPAPVAGLPSWALAASIDGGSCGVYWREDEGTEAVALIAQALRAWRDLLDS
jgi:hypothetical protein